MILLHRTRNIACILILLILTACTPFRQQSPSLLKPDMGAYVAIDTFSDFSKFAPIFLIEEYSAVHNRIGSPAAEITQSDDEHIYVDHETPAIFVQKKSFTTETGSYANFIYRIHFKEVPLSPTRFYLTSGANVGMLIVVTVNDSGKPVLVTSVHTCGCYLSFLPTSLLQETAFPENWDRNAQKVYGENLPGLIDLQKNSFPDPILKMILTLRSDTHRLMDIHFAEKQAIEEQYTLIETPLRPMAHLKSLPLNNSTTSFFEENGPRKGYVKGSYKPFERLLMSWWSFDLRVGEDKAYCPKEETGAFYTSLKYWARKDSDMRNFPQFLKYWGWNL
ncbi:MAG: hypothetical protein H8E41_05245 [Desulfobulbaceae bacterium]|uniref:Uncharacterized protein n=1 Tax=Candidatus Desulfobia pelagia TaxID=2841692 RepID=A0A8J6NE58_9BACT|nr:hypothetical protein [Candidatus Desulfobia pelagia]